MTNGRIRVGVFGLSHDHVWKNLERLVELETAELVGAAEPDEQLREQFRQRFGDREIVSEYDALFEPKHDLQAIYAFSDNRTSALLAIQAAERGLHAMMEKPMASSLALADALRAAAQRSGVQVMVNWPHNWSPQIREAHRLVSDGAIGEVFKLRYAGGHAGPREIGCSPIFCDWLYDAARNGAGALDDQGGYAATICRWFLGRPGRVLAMGGQLTKTDITDLDNVAILLRYERALAIAEATWSWIGGWPPAGPLVYGTEGTLAVQAGPAGPAVMLVSKERPEPAEVPAAPLPAGADNASAYFISCIRDDTPIAGLVSPEVSRDAQEILEAAIQSIQTGSEVTLPLDNHLPGIGPRPAPA